MCRARATKPADIWRPSSTLPADRRPALSSGAKRDEGSNDVAERRERGALEGPRRLIGFAAQICPLEGLALPSRAAPTTVRENMHQLRRRLRRARSALVAVTICMAAIASTAGASADPVGDKQAQANQIAARIDALGQRESALGEQFNAANLRAEQVKTKVADATSRLQATTTRAAGLRSQLRARAVDTYVTGGLSGGFTGMSSDRADDPVRRAEYVRTFSAKDADSLDAAHAVNLAVAEDTKALTQQQEAAVAAAAQLDKSRRDVIAAESQLKGTQAQVTGDLAGLVAQAQAARQAQDAAQAQVALARVQAAAVSSSAPHAATPEASRGGAEPRATTAPAGGPRLGPPPAVGSGAQAAVAAAKSRLGAPYVWGAAGPDSFDCSGLMLWAWARGGKSLPHYSGAQYTSTTHISMADLQPGDLVFPASGSGHVAMYIGGGQLIEAPHTGDVVKIIPLSSEYKLASRP